MATQIIEEWKIIAMMLIMLSAGAFIGYMLLQGEAKVLATETCGTCISNYNLLVEQYNSEHSNAKYVPLLPNVSNQSVKVYVP